MYFKKTQCPNCQSTHDEMLDYCPFCHSRNELHQDFRKRHPLTFIPWYRELMMFLIGFMGMTAIALVFSFVFANIYQNNNELGEMLVNTFTYIALFVILVLVLLPYLRNLMDRFKNPFAYMWAGIGTAALLVFSIVYSVIIQTLIPDIGEGGNQTAVNNMVVSYPLVSILIIGIIGPIAEELTYRIGLFSLFRRVHPVLAYAGTAIIFGFIHFDFTSATISTEFIYLINYMFAGLCFSFIYDKGGFAASTLAHISNNLYSVLSILLLSYLS